MRNHAITWAGAAGLATLFAVSGIPGAAPDLAAVSVSGPGIVHVQSDVVVAINVANFGDPLSGDYTAEIVLSQDAVVDAGDLVVGSITSDFLGSQGVLASIPSTLDAGEYRFGLRVLPVAGETATANNSVIGTLTHVVKTDLHIEDTDAIELVWTPTSPEVPSAEVLVENIGSLGSILVYTVEALTPAPWLDLDPESSFAVAGEPGNAITLTPDPTGLALGTHTTTLRFQNFTDATDFVDIEVSLTIGAPLVEPKNRLWGHIAIPGDVDVFTIKLVKGQILKIAARCPSGNLKPKFTFVDPDGTVEGALKFPHTKQYLKKGFKVKRSGLYTVLIEGRNKTSGAYKVKLKKKLPKTAVARKFKIKSGQDPASVEIRTFEGTVLDLSIDPNPHVAGPLLVSLVDAEGATLDLTPYKLEGPGGEVVVENLQMDTLGSCRLEISGLGTHKKAKAKVSIRPVHPQKVKKKVYIP